MATEQTFTISGHDGSNTVVSGVTVPYTKSSDLEIHVSVGKIESIEIVDSGAGYSSRIRSSAEKLIFSGGGGTAPDLWVTVGQDTDNVGRIDGSIYGHATSGAALDNTNLNVGSGYNSSPNVSLTQLDGGEGGQLTANIYVKKTVVTDYTLSGTSGSATLTFTSALANGTKVKVKRVTDVTTAANTYIAGSSITAADLNKSFEQIRHKVEELPNVTSTAVTNGIKDDISVSGNTWTIVDDAVTTAKIINDAVDGNKLANNIDIAGTLGVTSNTTVGGNLAVTGNTTVGGTLTVTGDLTFNGNVDLGNALSDTISITGGIDTFLVPAADNTYSLGSEVYEWKDLYLDGTAHIDTLDVDENATVTGTLGVTGDLTASGALNANGGIACDTNKFTVADTTGNTAIAGTLTVSDNTSVAAGKTLTVGGPLILSKASTTLSSGELAVTHTWHEINPNSQTLATATGGTTGQILILTATSADLTITNTALGGGGTANGFVGVTNNLEAANGDTVTYLYNGTQWQRLAPYSHDN